MSAHPSIPLRIALRIEVNGFHAAQFGIPRMMDLLRRHRAGASFVCALGPDQSGRAIIQAFRPQAHGRAEHVSLARHFGMGALLFGSLLPAPQIGKRCSESLLAAHAAGFEIGVAGWSGVQWVSKIDQGAAAWSEAQLAHAKTEFERIFSTLPQLHAAPGWRSNPHALRLTQRLGFAYASDTRGCHPFLPVWHGEIIRCPQFPTTLPALDELAERGAPDQPAHKERLLSLTASPSPTGHVFSLRLEAKAGKQDELLEALFTGWREQGYELTSIQALANGFDMDKLPHHEVVIGSVPGRCGHLLVQGEEFLSAWRHAA